MNSKRHNRAIALIYLTCAAFSCLLISWIARELGAGWRLQNALGIVVGLGWLVIYGLYGGEG